MKKALKEMINSIKGVRAVAGFDLVSIKNDSEFYPLPLVEGNSKIGKVWHASTVPTSENITAIINGHEIEEAGTCPTSCRGCYATRGNFNYNSIKYALIMRTRLLRKYPDIYFKIARFQIISENIKLIRLHASGDFVPGEAAGWTKIFKEFKTLKGWTYTKWNISGEIKKLNNLHNFNIVDSIIKGFGFNFGHIDYILKVFKALKKQKKSVYICRCGIDKNQHCDNCGGCANNEIVLFIEHGTGYKADKDPLFDTIKTIIEAQPKQILNV